MIIYLGAGNLVIAFRHNTSLTSDRRWKQHQYDIYPWSGQQICRAEVEVWNQLHIPVAGALPRLIFHRRQVVGEHSYRRSTSISLTASPSKLSCWLSASVSDWNDFSRPEGDAQNMDYWYLMTSLVANRSWHQWLALCLCVYCLICIAKWESKNVNFASFQYVEQRCDQARRDLLYVVQNPSTGT